MIYNSICMNVSKVMTEKIRAFIKLQLITIKDIFLAAAETSDFAHCNSSFCLFFGKNQSKILVALYCYTII